MSATLYRQLSFLYIHQFNHATLKSQQTASVRRNKLFRFGIICDPELNNIGQKNG
jgi:hypothetical protein